MHVAILAPLAPVDLAHRLHADPRTLPAGYEGAPLVAVLVDALLAMGLRVSVITVQYGVKAAAPTVLEGPDLRVVVLPGRGHAWRFDDGLPGRALDLFHQERAALADAVEAADPDLVHAHWTYEFALAAIAGCRPHLVTAHDVPARIWHYTRSPYRALRWWMACQVLKRAQRLSAVSAHVARLIQPAARVPVAVVPNPVPPGALALGRVRHAAAAARVALVSNGFTALKNAGAAMQAFALLRQRLPQAELHLYGQGFERGGAADRWAGARALGAGCCFHGPLPHARLIAALAEHDLLVHPALEESFAVVVAEALALGLPVVAGANSGGVPEVAGGEQWLVDVRSPAALADALHQALTEPARYALASAAGRERVQREFSAPAVAARYVALYSAMLSLEAVA